MVKAFDGGEREPRPPMRVLLRASFSEFIAMLLFVYFGCGSASSNLFKELNGEWDTSSVLTISMTFGLLITVLAYGTAHASGGHINFAVTFALTLVGKCHPLRAIFYLVFQLAGSIAGAALLKATTSADPMVLDRTGGLGANGYQNPSVTLSAALIGEIMGTALLVFTVLESAVNAKAVTSGMDQVLLGKKLIRTKQNLAPIPIGLAVFVAHVMLVPITGCSINPTRSFGPSLVANSWENHWVWWVGPLAGAFAASLVWGIMMALDGPAAAAADGDGKKDSLPPPTALPAPSDEVSRTAAAKAAAEKKRAAAALAEGKKKEAAEKAEEKKKAAAAKKEAAADAKKAAADAKKAKGDAKKGKNAIDPNPSSSSSADEATTAQTL